MEQSIRIDFNPYALIYTDDTDIYDVSFIIIDINDKTIDVNDICGFTIAYIHYENVSEIGYCQYDGDENICEKGEKIIVNNGELVYEK